MGLMSLKTAGAGALAASGAMFVASLAEEAVIPGAGISKSALFMGSLATGAAGFTMLVIEGNI